MSPTPLPCRATARRGDHVVASSTAAVREEVAGGEPRLWFPTADVHEPAGTTAGAGDLADHLTFDVADDVTVELREVDAAEQSDDVVRFPNWGDVTDMVATMDVRPDGDGRWRCEPRGDWRRPVVEGSQLLGQSIVAAGRHAPGRRAVAASMVFARALDAQRAYHLVLDPVTDGRSFTSLRSAAVQGERTAAFGTLLLDVTAPAVLTHAAPPPDVGSPDDAVPHDMGVTGRDLRIVDGAYTGDPDAPLGPPELAAWVRFHRLPDDPPLHGGLLAQFTGHLSIAAAMRPHAGVGQDQAHRTLSTGINAISLSIHADVRADRWMLYHHRATVAADGMTHAECRVHDEDGALLASFTVDAMVRPFADPAHAADARRAM